MDVKSILKKLQAGKVSAMVEAPKKAIYSKVAEKLGIRPSENTQDTAMDIAQAAADKLGLPQDSVLADAAKAAAVAGMEVFTPDATMVLGPAGRLASRVAKIAKGGKAAESVLDYSKFRKPTEAIKPKSVTVDQVRMQDLARRQKKALEYKREKIPTEAKPKASLDELNKTGVIRIK